MATRTGAQSLPDPTNVGIVGAHQPLDPQGGRVLDPEADPAEVQGEEQAEKPAAKKATPAKKATTKKAAARKRPSERIR